MQKLTLDVDMKDVDLARTTIDSTYGPFTDADLRSPRTPTYIPTSPNSSKATAFDPSRIFASQDPAIEQTSTSALIPEPPTKPLAWVWQCHLCKSRFPLSVTRRCLQDGHFYCSGETDRPNLKKKKRGQSCSSEFDYIGWREWGEWKRQVLGNLENGVGTKICPEGCQNCEFPSQCRYVSSRAESNNGVNTSSDALSLFPTVDERDVYLPEKEAKSPYHVSENVTFDSILASVTDEQNELSNSIGTELGINASPNKVSSVKANSTSSGRIAKSAETRSSRKSTLSPIAEEFCFNTDLTKTSFGAIALQSWNDILGIGSPVGEADQMDLT
jgi:hypothetical protein